jgi:cell division protein FtsB
LKIIILILLVLLIWLQYKLWLGDGGIPEVLELEHEIISVQTEVDRLKERNQALEAEVVDLKKGNEAIEERARSEMGMIKEGETYYQVIGGDNTSAVQGKTDEQ